MAQRVVVELISDVSGEAADETVHFALDGVAYEIDLTSDEAKGLHESLAQYVDSGRKLGRAPMSGQPRRRASVSSGYDASAVREWAEANGIEVSKRGRIGKETLEKFHAAGN